MLTPEQIKAIQQLSDDICEIVKGAGPLGAPSGPMYAAWNAHGGTLESYQQFMSLLVRTGRLRVEGHLYFYVEPPAKVATP